MFFWNSLTFSMIQQMLAIWSLVLLPFLKSARTSGSHGSRTVEAWLVEFWALFTSLWDECNCVVVWAFFVDILLNISFWITWCFDFIHLCYFKHSYSKYKIPYDEIQNFRCHWKSIDTYFHDKILLPSTK